MMSVILVIVIGMIFVVVINYLKLVGLFAMLTESSATTTTTAATTTSSLTTTTTAATATTAGTINWLYERQQQQHIQMLYFKSRDNTYGR